MVTLNEVWIASPNYTSSRGPYNKLAFHTTEGAMKIRDLGAWFAQSAAACSSHHGADNYERGVFGAYVYESNKAWTQGNANPYCLSIELCAYASWSRSTWLNSKGVLVDNAAQWLRYMVDKYKVPWTLLSNAQAQDPDIKGICQHVNFGSWGSGHSDCGSGFPVDVVVDKARKWGGGSTPDSGGILVSSDVTFYQGKEYFAYINPEGRICVNGGVVDPGSNARSGVGLAIDPDSGKKVVTYTNTSGRLCQYEQVAGNNKWAWVDLKQNAK